MRIVPLPLASGKKLFRKPLLRLPLSSPCSRTPKTVSGALRYPESHAFPRVNAQSSRFGVFLEFGFLGQKTFPVSCGFTQLPIRKFPRLFSVPASEFGCAPAFASNSLLSHVILPFPGTYRADLKFFLLLRLKKKNRTFVPTTIPTSEGTSAGWTSSGPDLGLSS